MARRARRRLRRETPVRENELERRVVNAPVQLRGASATPMIEGYGALFGVETIIDDWDGGFRERIDPGAFAESIKRDDVRALFNHDPNRILGRNRSRTLRLREDKTGLQYECDVNLDDPNAVSVHAIIKRGDVSQSSFAFRIAEGGQTWIAPKALDELPLRIITKVILRDVSPVCYPAYPETTVSAREHARSLRGLPPRPPAAADMDRRRRALELAERSLWPHADDHRRRQLEIAEAD